jgi:hypothetical protein
LVGAFGLSIGEFGLLIRVFGNLVGMFGLLIRVVSVGDFSLLGLPWDRFLCNRLEGKIGADW